MCIWILTFVRPALVVLPAISFTASAILEEIMSGLTGITLRLNTGLEKWLFFLALQMNKGMTCKWNWKVRRDPGAQKGEHLWITGVLILSSFYSHFWNVHWLFFDTLWWCNSFIDFYHIWMFLMLLSLHFGTLKHTISQAFILVSVIEFGSLMTRIVRAWLCITMEEFAGWCKFATHQFSCISLELAFIFLVHFKYWSHSFSFHT